MKQAIVTGATGFIGASFVQYLLNQGVQVLALGRKEPEAISEGRLSKLEGAKYLTLDMESIESLPFHLKDAGWHVGEECIFFNLAWGGESRLSDLNIESQMRNVIHSVSALEAASVIGCSRFIQVGTMEEAFTQKYLNLDHHKHTYYNRHVIYSVAKMAARQTLEIKASQLGLDFIYVLHSHVMGPDDDKDSFLQVTLLKLIHCDDLIFSTGEQFFDVISLEDCALGYFLICQKGKPGKGYWVGSGNPRRLREYVERMYALFPSGKAMQFGTLPYNDIVLEEEVFSITELTQDTGYLPTMTYEQTVIELHKHLTNLRPNIQELINNV
jgi:nucleoside-diphosphate-sugar epimerase